MAKKEKQPDTAPKMTVIQGGRDKNLRKLYRFVEGEVTDTRLMGVLGMHLHWRFTGGDAPEDIHQFWYYDIEEIGLDTLSFYIGKDKKRIAMACKANFGGLGARMVPVDEREARYLARHFVEDTVRKGEMLPPEIRDADYTLLIDPKLSASEIEALNRKLCTPIRTDNGVINYYLMRLFGKDEEGAALLRDPNVPPSDFGELAPRLYSTFLKNDIQYFIDANGKLSYLCESLIENDEGHSLIFSEIRVQGKRVISTKKNTSMRISESEASMKLTHEEFITAFAITAEPDVFDVDFDLHTLGTTESSYDAGYMYMDFRGDNDHVEKNRYCLDDDVQAVYFLTEANEMLVSASNLADIVRAETNLRGSPLWRDIKMVGKYRFTNPLLYDFAMSGEPSFQDYLAQLDLQSW